MSQSTAYASRRKSEYYIRLGIVLFRFYSHKFKNSGKNNFANLKAK